MDVLARWIVGRTTHPHAHPTYHPKRLDMGLPKHSFCSLDKWLTVPTMEVRPSTDLKARISFVPVRPRRTSRQHPATVETDESFDSDTVSTVNSSRLSTCPEEGCVKMFRRHSSFVKHVDCGTHKSTLEHETLYDKTMIEYVTKLHCGASKAPKGLESRGPSLPTAPTAMMGCPALKTIQSRRTKFTDKQRQYLNAKFQIGERTGKTADPTDFPKPKDSEEETPGEDIQSVRRDKVLSEVSIQHSHSIIYDSYNISELLLNSKLSSFPLSMLWSIESVKLSDLEHPKIRVRRKKPFMDLLSSLVQGCSCNGNKHS